MSARLGYAHPDYLLEDLTSSQISEWMAYNEISPIGGIRQDYGWAQICSVVTNLARLIYSKKGSEPDLTNPLEFIPQWGRKKRRSFAKEQSEEELKQRLLSFTRMHNRSLKRGRK